MIVTNDFVAGLNEIYALEFEKEKLDISYLVPRLEAIAESAKQRLSEQVIKLRESDPDNPVFCPVSLFRTMDYGRLETAHTRTLAWLLDPTKEHGFGSRLTDAFVSTITGKRVKVCDGVRVEAERCVKIPEKETPGRIDVWIEGECETNGSAATPFLGVIEAKIDAKEHDHQLEDYEMALDAHLSSVPNIDRSMVFPVFLTPKRTEPKTYQQYQWKNVTFRQVCFALWSAMSVYRSSTHEKRPVGYPFLRYYLAGVYSDIAEMSLPLTDISSNPCSDLNCVGEFLSDHENEAGYNG